MSTRVGDGVKYGEWYVQAPTGTAMGFPSLRYICTMGEDARDRLRMSRRTGSSFALFTLRPDFAHDRGRLDCFDYADGHPAA